ncbi:MAG: type II toxin-antitoxin system PemK/MazF family toxin [Janthinobacterium lividum]
MPFIPDELKRGDVVRVRLNPTELSEQNGERPALVLSPNIINRHSPIILIAPLTSKKTERVFPFEALIRPLA